MKKNKVLKTVRLSEEHINLIESLEEGSGFTEKLEIMIQLYFLTEKEKKENIKMLNEEIEALNKSLTQLQERAFIIRNFMLQATSFISNAVDENCYMMTNTSKRMSEAKRALFENIRGEEKKHLVNILNDL